MTRTTRYARFAVICLVLSLVASCGLPSLESPSTGKLSYHFSPVDPLTPPTLAGNTYPVLDPSMICQGSQYYLFSTDVQGSATPGNLPIRCSQDATAWRACGTVFPTLPVWVKKKVLGLAGLWAPDISYFNGLYHLYYAASTIGSQRSVIGLATNTSLDSSDPNYRWADQGEVLASVRGDDFNAIDPNILVESDGRVLLTYGSYWSGIK